MQLAVDPIIDWGAKRGKPLTYPLRFRAIDQRFGVTCARFMIPSEDILNLLCSIADPSIRAINDPRGSGYPIIPGSRSFTLLLESTDPWLQLWTLANWKIALGICQSLRICMTTPSIEEERRVPFRMTENLCLWCYLIRMGTRLRGVRRPLLFNPCAIVVRIPTWNAVNVNILIPTGNNKQIAMNVCIHLHSCR